MTDGLASLIPQTRGGVALAAACIFVAAVTTFVDEPVVEARRILFVAFSLAFVFAPESQRSIRLIPWGFAGAVSGLVAQQAMRDQPAVDTWLVLAAAVAGSLVVVRGGERASKYWLPEALSDVGIAQRRTVRLQMRMAVLLYLTVYSFDGRMISVPASWPLDAVRGALLALSAAAFLRFLLLQSKFLGLPTVPILRPKEVSGIVASQRWPFLILMALVACTRLPERVLRSLGAESDGVLLVTSVLLMVLAGLLFVLALVRLQRAGAWPRTLVRRGSFLAGLGLAVALAAAYVEMEPEEPPRYAAFIVIASTFVVVLPFVNASTALFHSIPNARLVVAPPLVAVMSAPFTVVNGARWAHASSGFLYAFATLVVVYSLVVVFREEARGKLYLAATLAVLVLAFVADGGAWSENGASFKVFLLAACLVLYALNLLERAGRVAKQPSV